MELIELTGMIEKIFYVILVSYGKSDTFQGVKFYSFRTDNPMTGVDKL